jgi:hypothetical protein
VGGREKMEVTVHAATIWNSVKDTTYEWRFGSQARERLIALAPSAARAFNHDNVEVNRRLREILAPIMRGADHERRSAACKWVISDWGGIRGNANGTLEAYANGLGDGTLSAADMFARACGVDGISSWSKVLAFAHPSHHAIYDSRTAVTLNVLLRTAGSPHRFWMPSTQNRQVAKTVRTLREENKTGAWLGYAEYLATLKAMVNAGAPSILRAEMALFASAPKLAEA